MQQAKTEIRTKPLERCFLCDSKGVSLYKDLSDPYFGAPGLWGVARCPNPRCGLIWLNPAPVAEDLHIAYQSYFTHGTTDGKPSASARLRDFCYRVYHAARQVPAELVGLETARKKLGAMFLDDLPPGKLLDVGCGDGKYLNKMRALGWKVDGIDFDSKAIANAKIMHGLDLRCGDLREANIAADTFDAITMSHVIEHLPEPLGLLAEIRRILKPGGRLVVTTPNSASLGHRKFGAYWFGIDPPRHVKIYSTQTLALCAEKAGLKVVRTTTSAVNADIFLGGSFSIRDSPGHRTHFNPQPNPLRVAKAIFLQYKEHLKLGGSPDLGEEAVLLCQK